jgi:hypothetical protein
MKIPVVREWGSWVVFSTSCLAGLVTGLQTRPWEAGRQFSTLTALTILGMTFLINAKNPLASAIRSKGKKEHVLWLLFFMVTGLVLLTPFIAGGLKTFAVFTVLVASYCILLSYGKEHHIIAELNGFALLTVAAPAVYFAVTGEMSWKLYLAVTLFFSAGVFKVRLRLRKTLFYRALMILYCALASVVFFLLNVPVIILMPLIENVITAIWLREEKLRTTGNIELAKSVVFLILTGLFWK